MRLARSLVILLSAAPAFAQYACPAILSRGDAPASMSTAEIDFRPFVNIAGAYTTGLSGLNCHLAGNNDRRRILRGTAALLRRQRHA